MRRLKPFNKFFRRYEVDLWGRSGFQRYNKTTRFLQKIQKEQFFSKSTPGRSFKITKKVIKAERVATEKIKSRIDRKENNKIKFNPKNKRKIKLNSKSNKNRINKRNKAKVKGKPKNKNKNKNFVYRVDFADPKRKRSKTSLSRELFLVKTKLLKFYNNIKKNQIRRYANTKTFKIKFKIARGYTNKALLKYSSANSLKKRLALNAFFSLVEHRLDVVLFRSNLTQTILQSRQFINHRHVFINSKLATHNNYILKNFDIVSLSVFAQTYTKRKLLINLKQKKITFYPPKYIFADYRFLKCCVVSNPVVSQIPFPFKIDLRKWLGLAKYMF